jgi:hypothetical protein
MEVDYFKYGGQCPTNDEEVTEMWRQVDESDQFQTTICTIKSLNYNAERGNKYRVQYYLDMLIREGDYMSATEYINLYKEGKGFKLEDEC